MTPGTAVFRGWGYVQKSSVTKRNGHDFSSCPFLLAGGFNSDIFYIALNLHISFYLKYDKIEITKAVREINIGP